MYKEDHIFTPTVSEPVMTQKRTKKQIYLEVLARGDNKSGIVTEDDVIAYDYWCNHVSGDSNGYTNMPMPPFLIDVNWVDERQCPWTFRVTFTNKQQRLMTGMHKAHIQCQVDQEGLTVKTAKKLLHADVMNEEFLVKLKKEILENNERNG